MARFGRVDNIRRRCGHPPKKRRRRIDQDRLPSRCIDRRCTDNVLVVLSDPVVARWVWTGWLWAAVLVGCVLAAGVVVRAWAVSTPVARAAGWPVLVTAGLANLAEAAYAAALLGRPAEHPGSAAFLTLFYLRATTLTLVAVALVGVPVQRRRRRRAVARLADDLATAPAVGALQSRLARSLGDKGLTVAYALPDSGEFVTHRGPASRPDHEPGPGQHGHHPRRSPRRGHRS